MRVFPAVLLLACLAWVPIAPAQQSSPNSYPTRPVRLLVGFAPGGTTDILARLMAPLLSERFQQQFYVDNRPGATGNIATELAARSPPDGSTLLVVAAAFASNVGVYRGVGYDPLRDFAPIARIANVHNVLVVHSSVPVKTVKELVALAKRRPGEVVIASPGYGSMPHLAMELLRYRTGRLELLHVAYKGMAPALLDLLGGQVHALVSTLPPALAHIRHGRLRALAVPMLKRTHTLPEVPTFEEAGYPGFEAAAWNGILAPAGTHYEILVRLNLAVVQIVRSALFRERLDALGAEPIGDTPDQFVGYLRAETAKWLKVAEAAGVRLE
jgi:tripartite-type tricarboxylate transporter receptor subunit TctC